MAKGFRPRKGWRAKLMDDKDLPKVVKIEGKMSKRWGTGTVAIPAPREVDELMRKVPKGKITTINEIRAAVAARHKATIGCPVTCGIFAWVAANAADEARAEGKLFPFTPHEPNYQVDLDAIPYGAKVAPLLALDVLSK